MTGAVVAFSVVFAFATSLADTTPSTQADADATVGGDERPSFPEPSPAVAERVTAHLATLRSSSNASERDEALNAIIETGSEAIPLVIEELERQHRRTWPASVLMLGAIGDPRVLPILEKELESQSDRTYVEVLYAMSLAGDESALVRALRSTAATASFEPGATAIDFIAGSRGGEAVPILIAEIPRRARSARAAALGALGTICDDRAVDFLLKWSRREDVIDRRFSLMALARIGDPRAVPRLLEALDDPDGKVREAAAEGLGYMGSKSSAPRLAELAKTGTPLLQARALWSLGLIGGETATRALADRFGRDDAFQMKSLTLQALGETGHELAVPALLKAYGTGDPRLALSAVEALVRIDAEGIDDELLTVCETSTSLRAALSAAERLVERGNPRALPCIVARLREEIAETHRLGPDSEEILTLLPFAASKSSASAIEKLAEEVEAPAIRHRLSEAARSIYLVHELGDDVDAWLEYLDDSTPQEVGLALEQLGRLRDPRALRPVIQLFGRLDAERAHLVPRSLGKIGSDGATSFLISLLVDDLYQVPSLDLAREEAAIALARYATSDHARDALLTAFELNGGRSVVPLLAYAHIAGVEAIPDLLRLKPMLLRRRGRSAVERHEKVNWAIRVVRSGRKVEIDELRDGR